MAYGDFSALIPATTRSGPNRQIKHILQAIPRFFFSPDLLLNRTLKTANSNRYIADTHIPTNRLIIKHFKFPNRYKNTGLKRCCFGAKPLG
jgi:hypothetical protein